MAIWFPFSEKTMQADLDQGYLDCYESGKVEWHLVSLFRNSHEAFRKGYVSKNSMIFSTSQQLYFFIRNMYKPKYFCLVRDQKFERSGGISGGR